MGKLYTIAGMAQARGINVFEMVRAVQAGMQAGMPTVTKDGMIYIDEETPFEPYLLEAERKRKERANKEEEQKEIERIKLPRELGITIHEKLGEGGSRTVYLATKEGLERPLKLKLYRLKKLSPEIQAQRQRRPLKDIVAEECNFLALGIDDPHVRQFVTQYFFHGTCKIDGEETFYILADYVVGSNVEEALPTLTLNDKCAVFKAIKTVVDYVHRKGRIIRDLKLNNTLISQDRKTIKVDDLETICEDLADENRLTKGSDRYAAPEIMKGEKATAASDRYALAVCLLYLLEGKAGGMQNINILPPEKKHEYDAALKLKVDHALSKCTREQTQELEYRCLMDEYGGDNAQTWLLKMLSYDPAQRS